MRITQGKVVGGRIVVEGEAFTEGATVTVLVADERTFSKLATASGREEEAALLEAIAEADRGKLLPAEDVLKQLP